MPSNSWLDDYFDWSMIGCCKHFVSNESFCPHSVHNETLCTQCSTEAGVGSIRPTENDFNRFLPYFLKDNPDPECAKAGHAAYGSVSILRKLFSVSFLTKF